MSRYLVRRFLLALVTLWALATVGFLLLEAIPGDPARQLAGPTASLQTVEAIRHAYGFDRPAWDRYVSTLGRYTHLDLGYAFSRSEGPKTYVQNLVAMQQDRVWSLIESGAVIYVCGDGGKMEPDVKAALVAIYRQRKGGNAEAGQRWIDELGGKNRYVLDVWASG